MIIGAVTLMQLLWARLQAVREDDRGMTTEAIIITSALAALAIVVTGLIVVGVRNEANTIRYEAPNP